MTPIASSLNILEHEFSESESSDAEYVPRALPSDDDEDEDNDEDEEDEEDEEEERSVVVPLYRASDF